MIVIQTLNQNPIEDIKYAAQATLGIVGHPEIKDKGKWIRNVVFAEHSIVDEARIRITDGACRSDVVSHLVRHTKGYPRHYVESHRPDWTKKPRPSDPTTPRLYVSTWSVTAFLAMGRQRLCKRAAKATRNWALTVKNLLSTGKCGKNDADDEFYTALSLAMVPTCVYRGGCPEGKKTCGYWTRMQEEYANESLQERAKIYQKGVIEWREN